MEGMHHCHLLADSLLVVCMMAAGLRKGELAASCVTV